MQSLQQQKRIYNKLKKDPETSSWQTTKMTKSTTNVDIATIASRFVNNTQQNVFLTGKAGTGKTTFLRHIIKQTYKNAVIAAPTGIAAINAGGVTLHSLFQLPFGSFVPHEMTGISENARITTPSMLLRNQQMNSQKRQLLQEMELLIIDEVSMLKADLLDAIDTVLKSVRRKRHLAFGGVQVLFIGDLLQLPPVVKDEEWNYLKQHYKTPFFFDAKVFQNNPPVYLELDKIYRQSDNEFISLLNNFRNNTVKQLDLDLLHSYFRPGFNPSPTENYIHLTTHNYKADRLNSESLQKINEKSFVYKAEIEGEFSESNYPVDVKLELKVGAQVMFVKNDSTGQQRYFNGKIGIVKSLKNDEIIVVFNDSHKEINVEMDIWENIKYSIDPVTRGIEENKVGSFKHYPLKLAWAITIHKSQGLTFEKAIVDLSDAFAAGQVYVALSRLTSLKGLILSSRVNTSSLNIDENVVRFAETKNTEEDLDVQLEEKSFVYFRNYILQSFDFASLQNNLRFHVDSYDKEENRSAQQKYIGWAKEIAREFEEVKTTSDKFLKQLEGIFNAGVKEYKKMLFERMEAAVKHFSPLLQGFSKKIMQHIEKISSEKKIKGYLGDLKELEISFFKQLQTIQKGLAMVKSANENTEFSKATIHATELNESRAEDLKNTEEFAPTKRARKDGKPRGKKQPKGASHKASLELYLAGKTFTEIAIERNLAPTTIEGHLASFIKTGEVKIRDFVTEEKQKFIEEKIMEYPTASLSDLKSILGEEYSYTELRMVREK